jgi:hypothetical protein
MYIPFARALLNPGVSIENVYVLATVLRIYPYALPILLSLTSVPLIHQERKLNFLRHTSTCVKYKIDSGKTNSNYHNKANLKLENL